MKDKDKEEIHVSISNSYCSAEVWGTSNSKNSVKIWTQQTGNALEISITAEKVKSTEEEEE